MVRHQVILAPYKADRTVAQIYKVDVRADRLACGTVEPAEALRGRKALAFFDSSYRSFAHLLSACTGQVPHQHFSTLSLTYATFGICVAPFAEIKRLR